MSDEEAKTITIRDIVCCLEQEEIYCTVTANVADNGVDVLTFTMSGNYDGQALDSQMHVPVVYLEKCGEFIKKLVGLMEE